MNHMGFKVEQKIFGYKYDKYEFYVFSKQLHEDMQGN